MELRQYEQAVQSAESQIVTTQAQLSAAQNSVQAIALPTVEEQAIAAAEADVELTRLQLDQLERSREDYVIRAAADGVIISTSLEAGATVGAGQGVFKLSSENRQYAVFYLPQDYLSQVAFGDELSLFLQGSQEEAGRGRVTYIDLQAVYENSPAHKPTTNTQRPCARATVSACESINSAFQRSTVTIRRNLQYTAQKGVFETSPKNRKSRVVDIGPETLSLLRQLQGEQAATCISRYVFSQDGTPAPMHPQSPTRYFKKFGQKYNVPGFHPHLLRHSSASVAITNGADVTSVSERLGHSDAAVTLRMYAHANEKSIRRAGQIVRDALKAEDG